MSTTRVIEINGVKMEVDLREATQIDTYKVGDIVKLLVKEYDSYKSYPGAIIGFDNFKNRPTIVVAYLECKYSEAEVKIAHIHEGGAYEMVHASSGDVDFSKEQVMEMLNKRVQKAQAGLDEAEWHRKRFTDWFGKHFTADTETTAKA